MPTYTFQNENTGETREMFLSMTEREVFLKTNPHMKQLITKAPSLGDSVRLGFRHHDQNFNDVLKNIKSHHHGSNIETR